jgi:hypothetical protein
MFVCVRMRVRLHSGGRRRRAVIADFGLESRDWCQTMRRWRCTKDATKNTSRQLTLRIRGQYVATAGIFSVHVHVLV